MQVLQYATTTNICMHVLMRNEVSKRTSHQFETYMVFVVLTDKANS